MGIFASLAIAQVVLGSLVIVCVVTEKHQKNMDFILDTLWYPRFWLPRNITWEIYTNAPGTPVAREVLTKPFVIMIFIIIQKLICEKYIFYQLGLKLGIHPPPYSTSGKGTPTLIKFTQHAFRFLHFFISTLFGIAVLWHKPWFWNSILCFEHFPFVEVKDEEKWYCFYAIGFYLATTATQFIDVRRGDATQIMIHHVNTLILIYLSYISNDVRIGCLILFIHDSSSALLELGRIVQLAGGRRLYCGLMFLLFSIFWVTNRLFIFAIYGIWPAVAACLPDPTFWPVSHFICVALLLCQLLLNLRWTVDIAVVASISIREGKPCFEAGRQKELTADEKKKK